MDIIRKHDWVITAITWILVVIGIITIYSITYNADSPIYGQGATNKQIISAILGLAVYVFVSTAVDYTYFKNLPVITVLYLIVMVFLVAVIVIDHVNHGAARWINLGPLNLEPSELSKILMILISSSVFYKRLQRKISTRKMILSLLPVLVVLGLVFIQPDLSTTLSLIAIVAMVFISSTPNPGELAMGLLAGVLGLNLSILAIGEFSFYNNIRLGTLVDTIESGQWFIFGGSLAVTLFLFLIARKSIKFLLVTVCVGVVLGLGYTVAWDSVLQDYQKERINTFVNPESDPLGVGYQVKQSMIATGSGQIWGRGFGRGTQSNLNFLPERHTDFIFASFAEEFGFVGSVFLIIMYGILIARIIYVGLSANEHFGYLICIGVATMLLFQFTINVGMNIGLMPVTGVTLPLFSYGGSSLLTTLIGIGLVQSVAKGRDLVNMEDSLIVRE